MKTKNSKILLVIIVCLAVLVCGFAVWHFRPTPVTALTPRTVSAAKVPDGWYESLGTPPVTVATLTKQDNYVIAVTSVAATGTPEEYVAGVGLAGVNGDAMGLKGTWSTFMGHRMFAVDSGDLTGYIVILFGNNKEYTFQLSHDDPSDATAFWQVITFYTQPEFFADNSDWKTYTDPSTGFSMKYPPQYSIDAHVPQPLTADDGPPMYGWGTRTLLQIYNPASTSTGEFTIGPVQVTLQKQPITASGKIYHTIAEYQSSGTAAQMIQGASNPNGQLVGIESGEQALFYPLPANPDTGTDPIDSFTFIKNDLIYSVSFDANDPNERAMLESIAW